MRTFPTPHEMFKQNCRLCRNNLSIKDAPLPAIDCLRETRPVKVERDAGARTRQAEGERGGVAGERERGDLVLVQQVGPLNHVVVAEEVERL